jgi:hypothetical protein
MPDTSKIERKLQFLRGNYLWLICSVPAPLLCRHNRVPDHRPEPGF